MSQLEDDLEKYADDALTKRDAKAAISLIAEICGYVGVMWAAAAVISFLFGPAGIATASTGACYYMLKRCNDVYSDLPSDQRKLIRKLARGIRRALGM